MRIRYPFSGRMSKMMFHRDPSRYPDQLLCAITIFPSRVQLPVATNALHLSGADDVFFASSQSV